MYTSTIRVGSGKIEIFLNKWILIGVVFGGGVVLFRFFRIRSQKRLHEHIVSHSVLSDEAFLSSLKIIPDQYFIGLGIRNAAAKVLQVPSETIYASDSIKYLQKLGFEISSFILELESMLSIDINYEVFANKMMEKETTELTTLGDLVHFFVTHPEFITVSRGC